MSDTNTDWMKDPALAGIDKNKLIFLEKLFFQGSKLTQKEMMPFLLSLSKQSRENNISFQKDEIKLIYSVLQKYSTPEDIEKMKKFSSYFQQLIFLLLYFLSYYNKSSIFLISVTSRKYQTGIAKGKCLSCCI